MVDMCHLTSIGVTSEELAMIYSSLGLACGRIKCFDHPAGRSATPGVVQGADACGASRAGSLVSGLDAG